MCSSAPRMPVEPGSVRFHCAAGQELLADAGMKWKKTHSGCKKLCRGSWWEKELKITGWFFLLCRSLNFCARAAACCHNTLSNGCNLLNPCPNITVIFVFQNIIFWFFFFFYKRSNDFGWKLRKRDLCVFNISVLRKPDARSPLCQFSLEFPTLVWNGSGKDLEVVMEWL